MVKPELARNQPNDGDSPTQPLPKREPSQATLSTVGDITVAATDSIGHLADAPRATRWFPILAFFLLMYVATCLAILFSFKREPWIRAFLTPLFPRAPRHCRLLVATGMEVPRKARQPETEHVGKLSRVA